MKLILFKDKLQSYVDQLRHENDLSLIVLNSTSQLLTQLPDISACELDTISDIQYLNSPRTDIILDEAKDKLKLFTNGSTIQIIDNDSLIQQTPQNHQRIFPLLTHFDYDSNETSDPPPKYAMFDSKS
jgi:hypothetical protein